MSLSGELWQENHDLVAACVAHPLIRDLQAARIHAGTLHQYLGQRAYCLDAIGRACNVISAKAPDWECFRSLQMLMDQVLDVIDAHHEVATRVAAPLTDMAPLPPTQRYADFLAATTWGDAAGLGLLAICPALQLQTHLAEHLAESHHAYARCLATDAGGQELAAEATRLADRYGDRGDRAAETYRYALHCELELLHGVPTCA